MKSLLQRNTLGASLVSLARDISRSVDYYRNEEDHEVRRKVVSLTPRGRPKGNILISRNQSCFFMNHGDKSWTMHQSHWEVHQLATIFLNLGYAVDVIHYLNNTFVPEKDYVLFWDVKWNMERIGPLLSKDCVKILQPVTTHPLFQADAELRRLRDLQQRRGITLRPRRQDAPNWGIEYADCAIFTGNAFTMSTYRYAGKPSYRVPCATPCTHSSPGGKDFDRCRNRFLFLSGKGMVHKGLDRVLDAFATMPHLSLVICGSVEKEPDFVRAYRKELYGTDNIRVAGWMDVNSQAFEELANSCVALIHPSCSEGGATSVVACMHAGLIPIASVESSVDIEPEFGVLLRDSSVAEISQAVQDIATLPALRLREIAQAAWQDARDNHSCERFTEEHTGLVSRILAQGKSPILSRAPATVTPTRPVPVSLLRGQCGHNE